MNDFIVTSIFKKLAYHAFYNKFMFVFFLFEA